MIVRHWKLLFAIFVVVVFAGMTFAQGPGPGMGMSNYDPKTEVSVKGTVEDVQQQQGRHGWMGTHLMLKSPAGNFDVHVGPSTYVADKGFSFAKGDAIEVVGSKVVMQNKNTLLAREIIKDGKTLVLRNAQGIPLWSGGQGRAASN